MGRASRAILQSCYDVGCGELLWGGKQTGNCRWPEFPFLLHRLTLPLVRLQIPPAAHCACSLIPTLLAAEWFYRITRAEAEALLTADGRNGVFLVRESHTRKGTFTLSFLHDGLPRHCRIFNTLDGQFAADSYKAFDTLEDLVEW